MDWTLIAKTAETSWWLQPGNYLAILMMAAGLGVLIFVHELGHFVVAKLCGVKCEKFYLGFDIPIGKLLAALFKREHEVTFFGLPIPRTIVKFQWGETEYGIGVLPLGGYVKMLGQDDNPTAAARERERSRIKKETPEGSKAAEAPAATAEGEEEFVLDPRSYQAKNVPQRMAIISAGVIMNLLTAPIFATAAYMIGVDYQPCVVGAVVPGGPAYKAGIAPGDRILELGGFDDPNEHIRFTWDLRQGMAMVNPGEMLKLLVRHHEPDGKSTLEKKTIKPHTYYIKKGEKSPVPSIGIVSASTNEIASPDVFEGLPSSKAEPPLEDDDLVVALRPVGETQFESVDDGFELERKLIAYADRPLELKVERKTDQKDKAGKPMTKTVVSKVQPNKFRDFGTVMKTGPIDAFYPGGPADKAGIKPGDVIKSVAGTPFGGDGIDPMLLTEFLRPHFGKPVTIEVQRGGKVESIEVTPETPGSEDVSRAGAGAPMSCAALGMTYPVLLEVDFVRKDSPAATQGLKAGDVLTDITFLPRKGKENEDEETQSLPNKGAMIELDDESINWTYVYASVQMLPENPVRFGYQRGGKAQEAVEMTSVQVDAFNPDRGFVFASLMENHRADSFGEACMLGYRETKENFVRVLIFLKKLATGGISPTNLGGPGMIAVVATSQASQGPSSLLLFMTFLSVNLAIVNFLPIPVLDGGHMMFLLYEALRGKPADERWQTTLTLIGFAFLLCLMVFVIGLDIWHLAPS